jgi:hypothetical protein
MSEITKHTSGIDLNASDAPHFSTEQSPDAYPAWEEVDPGRFMPRRVRGSCQGRALG